MRREHLAATALGRVQRYCDRMQAEIKDPECGYELPELQEDCDVLREILADLERAWKARDELGRARRTLDLAKKLKRGSAARYVEAGKAAVAADAELGRE